MRLKELSREQLEKLLVNLIWTFIGLGTLFVVLTFIAAILLLKGK